MNDLKRWVVFPKGDSVGENLLLEIFRCISKPETELEMIVLISMWVVLMGNPFLVQLRATSQDSTIRMLLIAIAGRYEIRQIYFVV